MKTKCIPLVAAISALCLMWGCSQSNSQAGHDVSQESPGTVQTENRNAVELVSNITTTQYFTDDKVSNDDIETILMAGINTPSAMNGQPWHFSVITDAALLQQISEDMSSGMRVGRGTPPDGADMPVGKLPEDGELPEYGELPAYGELPDGFDADGDRDSPPPARYNSRRKSCGHQQRIEGRNRRCSFGNCYFLFRWFRTGCRPGLSNYVCGCTAFRVWNKNHFLPHIGSERRKPGSLSGTVGYSGESGSGSVSPDWYGGYIHG